MSAVKHSPRPWTANIPTRDNGRAEVYSGNVLVAQSFNWLCDATGAEYCEADARLIAASPELLEALEKLLRAVRSNNEGGTPKTQDQIFAEAGHAAIAAITKATGGAA